MTERIAYFRCAAVLLPSPVVPPRLPLLAYSSKEDLHLNAVLCFAEFKKCKLCGAYAGVCASKAGHPALYFAMLQQKRIDGMRVTVDRADALSVVQEALAGRPSQSWPAFSRTFTTCNWGRRRGGLTGVDI